MPANTQPKRKRAPEVMVFKDTTQAKSTASKHEYKSFMTSKISKLNNPPAPLTKKERKEEQQDKKNDKELQDLLEGKLMIEKLHESQLTGRERHKYNTQKLAKLGMKVKSKEKMPADMYFAVQRNRQAKADKHIKDAKDRGVLNASMKRELEIMYTGKASAPKDSRPRKDTDRGLRIGSGKFKDGVLHISKNHIDRVSGARAGKSKKGGNNPRSGPKKHHR
ncbi:hypothetical protein IW140_005705 [Coemansia sp. RSA 1813]|nr:hypothetical protein EV178_006191 [Coemansia sp. RSA 1646]KAJ1768267.1 hypothetical protein LPJ74_004932 [Coemansia sp. RSA 1843]KAJ2085293.1 hypothetical protein IW138_006405 [Coemansia sp. RSA 986]KAJ2210616.1 hypothetical protein EV179_006112 [Coemansia sp. RSA 487]KAJ2564559.1 hypothetical protein IW140_005705 [Coemansia sp. RSA 1813]